MAKYYAGIGSRQTPTDVLTLMARVAARLAADGWTLRSGHAQGADRAFETGADGKAVIYLPWVGFGTKPYKDDPGMPVLGSMVCLPDTWVAWYKTVLLPRKIHSSSLPVHMKLHGRNVAQVMGHEEAAGDPKSGYSRFVLCWCPESAGYPTGGTATAVKLARQLEIPVFNLFHPDVRLRIEEKYR